MDNLVSALIAHKDWPFCEEWNVGWLFFTEGDERAYWTTFGMSPDKESLVNLVKGKAGPRDVYVVDKKYSEAGGDVSGCWVPVDDLGEPEFCVEENGDG